MVHSVLVTEPRPPDVATVRDDEDDATSGATPGAYLLVLGPGEARTVPVPQDGLLVLGRDPKVLVRLEDEKVSRRHAQVRAARGEVTVEDLGSTNGTYVNGERLTGPRVLAHGDEIRIGGTVLTLLRPSRPIGGPRPAVALGALRACLGEHDSHGRATPGAEPSVPDAEDIELHDPTMRKIYRLADMAARSTSSVLILGETGVGKEEVAKYVHRRSPRRGGPLIVVNCAALPEPLVESMLFGHEKGAFTGATERHAGYIEAAAGGTLFLDEIGELPLASQSKLLRFLDRRTVCRVGSTVEIPVDVRVVTASKRDLAREVKHGGFREDLFYRIAVVTIYVPPLRDRPMDVLPLALRFARQAAMAIGREPPEFKDEVLERMMEYPWPGNVRELRNAVESAVVLAGDEPVAVRHLPPQLQRTAEPASAAAGLPARVAELERDAILGALRECGGNQTRAARKLGVSRRTLIYRMRKYGIRLSRTTEH